MKRFLSFILPVAITVSSLLYNGGAIIQHKSSISLEMPTELGKLITPDPINFEIAIGKKDDFAGSVYVYYIDENKHNYNTSYVTFELEYKKQ